MPIVDNAPEIRDRAYYLWEQAGKPCGREHEFWAKASLEIEGEERPAPEDPSPNRYVAR